MKLLRWTPPLIVIGSLVALWRAFGRRGGIIIVGAGNSGNRFGPPDLVDELAEALAALPALAPITEAELAEAYAGIRRRAVAGEIDAALVLFNIARRQADKPAS